MSSHVQYRGGKWTLGDNVVQHFIRSELARQGIWTRQYVLTDNFARLPDGVDNAGQIIQLSKHHIIPQNFINAEIYQLALYVEQQRDGGNTNPLVKFKNRLQLFFNHEDVSDSFTAYFKDRFKGAATEEDLGGLDMEVAMYLREAITWYPDNLFVGPEGVLRRNDPGNDLDVDILQALKSVDNEAFKAYETYFPSFQLAKLSDFLRSELRPSNTKRVKTIFHVLQALKKGAKGPLWKESNNTWLTETKKGSIKRRDLTKMWKTRRSANVNVETGDILYVAIIDENGHDDDRNQNADDDDE